MNCKKRAAALLFIIVSLFVLCTGCYLANIDGLDSFEKEITSFAFETSKNVGLAFNVTGSVGPDTVTITVPFGTDLDLIPTIGISGKSVSPVSGAEQTFTDGVGFPYTVTAQDGSTKAYTVIVNVAAQKEDPPACVTLIKVTEDDTEVSFQWTDPPDADLDHIEITWTPGGAAINSVNAGVETFTATGLTNGTEYTFSLVSVDLADNKSAAVTVTATPTIYCIYTADDLNAVRGGIRDGWDKTKTYIVMADIDLSSYSPWTPIGTSSSNPFSGNFNGNGHDITKLYINTPEDYQGLFGYISGDSIIENVRIIDCDITGRTNIGGLAGYFYIKNSGGARIADCYVSGNIASNFPNPEEYNFVYIAGLVGRLYSYNSTNNVVLRCGTNVTITMPNNSIVYSYIGGLVAQQDSNWSIKQCYSVGNFVNTDASMYIAGLVSYSKGAIEDSYSRINVTGTFYYIGGLIGRFTGTVERCYTTGDVNLGNDEGTTIYFGGLAGDANGKPYNASDAYFCGTVKYKDGTEVEHNDIGTRKDVSEMKQQSTYSGWNFTTVWNIDGAINNGFPYLQSNPP